MVEYLREVTDIQWSKIELLLRTPVRSPKGGRKRLANRDVCT